MQVRIASFSIAGMHNCIDAYSSTHSLQLSSMHKNIIVSDKGEAERSLPLQLIEKSSILLRQHTAIVTAHLSRVMTCVNG